MAILLALFAASAGAQPSLSYSVRTLDGAALRVGAGEPPTVVAVFATWCTTCRGEFPVLDSLHDALKGRGIRVLALSVDDADDSHVQRYTSARKTRVLVAHDASGAVGRTFGTVGVPESYLVDAMGIVRWRGRGDIRAGLADLRLAIAALQPANSR